MQGLAPMPMGDRHMGWAETETETERQTHTHRERQTERQGETEKDRDRDRETESYGETEACRGESIGDREGAVREPDRAQRPRPPPRHW